jgi:endonuclease/exonuclease/phosphatase family metal-dependent hydrolase
VRPLIVLLAVACHRPHPALAPATSAPLRVATWNVSLFGDAPGDVAALLSDPGSAKAAALARVLQEVRPDVLLLNEIDADGGRALDLLADRWLAEPQGGARPLSYPHRFSPPSNTGQPSGLDLDRDGVVTTEPGGRAYGGDAFGFGVYPGQYGLAVLSRLPIVEVHTFAELPWSSLPGARWPDDLTTPEPGDFWPAEVRDAARLSSKTHADVTLDAGFGPLHLWVSHPTPPVFDPPTTDRNRVRNAEELGLTVRWLDGAALIDDDGVEARLPDDAAVIVLGDLNNDPWDGQGDHAAIQALLRHPRLLDAHPRSDGAVADALREGGANLNHAGPADEDTAEVAAGVGNLRLDHALPSANLGLLGAGVFWPRPDDPAAAWLVAGGEPVSDHHLVWVDVAR